MVYSTIPVEVAVAAGKPRSNVLVPRLIAGAVLLSAWEIVVRLLAPPFVAKPTAIVLAINRVIVDPAFLGRRSRRSARGGRLCHRADIGTIAGLTIGRRAVANSCCVTT